MSDKAYIAAPKSCNFDCDEPAKYDFRTKGGSWANGCEKHWKAFRMHETLGTGKGQELIVGEPPVMSNADRRQAISEALDTGDPDLIWDAVGDGDIADWL